MINMNVFVLGRSLPVKNKSNIGIFEYSQAKILSKKVNVTYIFCDNQSLKVHKKFKFYKNMDELLKIYGLYLPIGGLYKPFYEKFKYYMFKLLYKKAVKSQGKPDIIHIHYPIITVNQKIISFLKQQGIKIVVTEHWSKIAKLELNNYEKEKLFYLSNNVDSFNVVSPLLRDAIFSFTNFGFDIGITSNFVSDKFLEKEIINQKIVTFKMAFVGRYDKNKNIEFLVKAMPSIMKRIPNIELNLYGDGRERENIKKIITDLSLENYVNMHGFISNEKLPDKLMENNIYVSASELETFGVPYIEAMALGLPVVSPINGALDDLLIKNYGELFENNDIESFVNAIQKVYDNYNKIDRNFIKQNIKSKFSESTISNELIEIYNIIIDK